ncbi:MAG: hypothetical protein IPJ19_15535 [Planctomycetes bacterium]|nr:hypothetical protein [Planctomycetota bacterium]
MCSATDVRAKIRQHPRLSLALGAGLGFVVGPILLRALQRVLGATADVPVPGALPPYTLAGAVLASLRILRAKH